MNNVYFFQVADAFSSRTNQMYLPYAVGTLAAKAWSDPVIAKQWTLKKIFCKRESPETIVNAMTQPRIAAFSNYIWNYEFNLFTAQLIKERFPECMVIFGGHHICAQQKILETNPNVDILIFGEGEEIFEKILLSFTNGTSLDDIPNIAFRQADRIIQTPVCAIVGTEYPSPYTMGIFDEILRENPGTSFSAILETNRGCPYHCAYCDWGPLKSKVRMFSLERVQKDIQWFAEHKIDYVWGADGNFGLFARDREIADMLVKAKKKTGYPQQIKVNYAKMNGENVFFLTKAFAENGLSKSTTMSLQSTSEDALRITGRKNMSSGTFSELVSLYRHYGIPTYTELILALPGETKASFYEGLGNIIASGQHSVIEVYDCIVLPNSTLADPAYRQKYGVRSVRLPYIQQHTSMIDFEITEYSETVIETLTMTAQERADCRYLAVVTQCFHSMGLLRTMAIYSFLELKISYTTFYRSLSEWLLTQSGKIWNVFPDIYRKIGLVNHGINEQYIFERSFGDVYWPMDEGGFLYIVMHLDDFFTDIEVFLQQLLDYNNTVKEVLRFCKLCVRTAVSKAQSQIFSYDFLEYYSKALENKPESLKKCSCIVNVLETESYDVFSDYAREIVWFGRRSQKTNLLDSDNLITVKGEL